MTDFVLDPRLAEDTEYLVDMRLTRVLLMNNCQYPWLILVPRKAKVREIYELSDADLRQLWQEVANVGERFMQFCSGHKLNVAALGNMVPQLHVHVVVRFRDDFVWPGPVWGAEGSMPYSKSELKVRVDELRRLLATQS